MPSLRIPRAATAAAVLLLASATTASAQLGRLGKKATDAITQKANQKVDQKIDQAAQKSREAAEKAARRVNDLSQELSACHRQYDALAVMVAELQRNQVREDGLEGTG